jgi:4-amino-4-deoxy-L-arabinose transferase-like glycosyltransferase
VISIVDAARFRLSQQQLVLPVLLTAAFLVRLGVRVAFGEEYFWSNSYSSYYDIAKNIASGKGFLFGDTHAWLTPAYPLFLALTTFAGKSYFLIIVPQALIGAGTALCAFLIGRQLFQTSVGILACGITAFYPYYVMHDTALQETGMITFGTALSVWLLLRAGTRNRNTDWFMAGLSLGAITLVRASAASIVAVALVWCAIWGSQGIVSERLRNCIVLLLGALVIVGPWLIQTYHSTGSPVLNSQTGRALWMGNNAETFSRYPKESIDRSTDEAISNFTEEDWAQLKRVQGDEIATSNWFARRALTYVRANPSVILQGAFKKLEAGFSWILNPIRAPLAQFSYAIAYVPIVILGSIGIISMYWRREVILIEMLFLAFMCVTVVFWAHTSHRSYLDVYLIVFAASLVRRLLSVKMTAKGFPKLLHSLLSKIIFTATRQ